MQPAEPRRPSPAHCYTSRYLEGERMRAFHRLLHTSPMKTVLLLAMGLMVASIPAHAQAALSPSPQHEFEVASIRLVDLHSLEDMQRGVGLASISPFPANLFTAKFMPLSVIIQIAYGVDGNRISGKPGWLDDQLYEVSAKVEGDAMLTHEQMEPLLQNLLQQRFHLAVHRESKSVPGYVLIVAKGGAKLKPSKEGDKSYFYILPNGIEDKGATMSTLAGMLE